MSHLGFMTNQDWRQRLERAIENDGRSMREISLAAGLSHGYIHGIMKDNKEPTLDRFQKICEELNVSAAYIMMGVNISRNTEKIIEALASDKSREDAILALLASSK